MAKFKGVQSAEIDWQTVPISKQFDDVYFILPQEVQQVFLQPNELSERFVSATRFVLGETGFGTGLNFLATVELWLAKAPPAARLYYYSVEKHPLRLTDLQTAYQDQPLADLAQSLIQHYPALIPGWHRLELFDGRVTLQLYFGDALQGLSDLDTQVDAWFLDGFTPSKNPDMWQSPLFKQLRRLSHSDTTLATFTAASQVRRGLQQAGFEVKKIPGFGAKREMIKARVDDSRSFGSKTPWFDRPKPITRPGDVTVLGAGLAGSAVAYVLAQKGLKVRVLDSEPQSACGASGNLAGAVHPLVTADWNLRSQWYWQGFQSTLRHAIPWLEQAQVEGDLSGLMHLAVDDTHKARMQSALEQVGLPVEFAQWLDKFQASQKLGGAVNYDGLWFAQGGWLNPPSVVKACLSHPNIHIEFNQTVETIEYRDQAWCLETKDSTRRASNLVLATGALSVLNVWADLPIRPLKGQVTHLEASHQTWCLNKAMAHLGYSAPCGDGRAVTGATFEAPSLEPQLSQLAHQQNLAMAHQAAPGWIKSEASEFEGRVGFRPTSPDHLPIVGAVPDRDFMTDSYLTQPHNLAVFQYPAQRYQPGLYVTNGHGARGLMSVFLAAEILAADILGEPMPIAPSLYNASHPARFAIRPWRRGHA